jgi:hypothetical protein
MLARVLIPAALLLLTACAAAMPGYNPGSFKSQSKYGKPLESGDVQENGRYEMSATEKGMDCKRLTGSMRITIARLKDTYGRTEPSAAAQSAQGWGSTLFGGPRSGADRDALYTRELAKLEAYNEELGAKGCKQLDITAELAREPDAPGKKY